MGRQWGQPHRQLPMTSIEDLASLNAQLAQVAKAETLGIPRVFDSYAGVLNDPAVDAVYIPLPNHLHVEWAVAAARAGKHVLCEKPIAMSVAEAEHLAAVQQECGVQIGEAFMVATHPQWLRVREWVRTGKIGQLRAIQGFFSYHNVDPGNIRNKVEAGGGEPMAGPSHHLRAQETVLDFVRRPLCVKNK